MLILVFTLLGSAMIGIGAGSWWIGIGVAIITTAFLFHFGTMAHSLHTNLINNMRQIYNKIG